MQLHACLLLFIITTDKTLALSDHHCGGNISLDQEPAGNISLTLPDTDRLGHANNRSDTNLTLCTWLVDIPAGRTVVLKLVQVDGGSSISVRCVGAEEDRDQVLEDEEALLSGCDGNKATLTWTGAGHSSVQLVYYVQEDERNSSGGRTTHRPGGDLVSWSQTGTSFTRTAPVSQDVVRWKEEGRGLPSKGLERSHGPQSASGLSSEDQGPPHPTTPLQGPAVAGTAERETLPLPEEGPNNGADTSGGIHLTDSPISAREGTLPYFHTQPLPSRDASNAWSTETSSSDELAQTRTPVTDAAASSSGSVSARPTASSFSIPALGSSLPELPSRQTWESRTLRVTDGGAVSEEKRPHSWTNAFGSNLTSVVTPDPVRLHTKPPQDEWSSEGNTPASPSQDPGRARSPTTHVAGPADSWESTTPGGVSLESDGTTELRSPTSSSQSPTDDRQSSGSRVDAGSTAGDATPSVARRPWTPTAAPMSAGTAAAAASHVTPSRSLARGNPSTDPATLLPPVPSTTPVHSPTPARTLRTHTVIPYISHTTHTPGPLSSSTAWWHHIDLKTTSATEPTSSPPPHTQSRLPSPPSLRGHFTTTRIPPLPLTTAKSNSGANGETELEREDESWRLAASSTAAHTPTAGPPSLSWSAPHPTLLTFTSSDSWSPATSQPPKYYIVPDQPAAIKVETIELLLQIILEDSGSAAGLEDDAAAWVEPYLEKAPGFSRLLGVWSSGHAVQNLMEFHTSGALQWLSMAGATSLLERTGLAQAVREASSFGSSKVANITLGGQQGDVCDWLLQCPPGFQCVSQLGTANYSCSSRCHFEHCHHHGICTHHPGQLPVCRCLVGDDFWYMGQRCDVRMTRARLVGACLAVLLIIVSAICVLALVAVRRYRAILIQAKVDQTRSSYRRFNHFDELSGRFWLRSWAGSADSLDNPAFTRSDEILHLRALDRPCCYHDDTLSLASTCPSHGMRINTIYPHSSQYAWRASEMSVGDGVLDSGKASDLSVCSWPVEPIQWTPFPLLQQLASHRTPTVRVSRPRSYCEGMELEDLERSWTA